MIFVETELQMQLNKLINISEKPGRAPYWNNTKHYVSFGLGLHVPLSLGKGRAKSLVNGWMDGWMD